MKEQEIEMFQLRLKGEQKPVALFSDNQKAIDYVLENYPETSTEIKPVTIIIKN